jgi:hypothetical protein
VRVFEKRVLRCLLGVAREVKQEAEDNCMKRSFIIFIFAE